MYGPSYSCLPGASVALPRTLRSTLGAAWLVRCGCGLTAGLGRRGGALTAWLGRWWCTLAVGSGRGTRTRLGPDEDSTAMLSSQRCRCGRGCDPAVERFLRPPSELQSKSKFQLSSVLSIPGKPSWLGPGGISKLRLANDESDSATSSRALPYTERSGKPNSSSDGGRPIWRAAYCGVLSITTFANKTLVIHWENMTTLAIILYALCIAAIGGRVECFSLARGLGHTICRSKLEKVKTDIYFDQSETTYDQDFTLCPLLSWNQLV